MDTKAVAIAKKKFPLILLFEILFICMKHNKGQIVTSSQDIIMHDNCVALSNVNRNHSRTAIRIVDEPIQVIFVIVSI